jgi:ABC-type phosphonate transport system ATPase subunit
MKHAISRKPAPEKKVGEGKLSLGEQYYGNLRERCKDVIENVLEQCEQVSRNTSGSLEIIVGVIKYSAYQITC